MKTIPALGYGEAESLMTDTVDIYHCLAAWHSRVCRLRLGPAPPDTKQGCFVYQSAFFHLCSSGTTHAQLKGKSSNSTKKDTSLSTHVCGFAVSLIRCRQSGAGVKPPGLGRRGGAGPALSPQPRRCRQTPAGARVRWRSLWHDRRYRKAELHKPEQFKV